MISFIHSNSLSENKLWPFQPSFLSRVVLITFMSLIASSSALVSKLTESSQVNTGFPQVSQSHMRNIDFGLYRRIQAEQGIDSSFIHVEKVMEAVQSKKRSFEAVEINENILFDNKTILEDFLSKTFQRTVFQYDLKNDRSYHSFDHIKHLLNLISISKSSFVKCEFSFDDSIQVHDIIISSKDGYSKTSRENHGETSIPQNVHSFMTSDHMKRHKGFSLIREVRFKEPITETQGSQTCYKYYTNDLHPLEIFHEFNIQSSISPPIKDMFPEVFEPGLSHDNFHDRLIHLQGTAPCTDGFFKPGWSCNDVCVWVPFFGNKCSQVCFPPTAYIAADFNGFAFSVGTNWFCVD